MARGHIQASVEQGEDFSDEFDQIINQLIDEDTGEPFEMSLPALGIQITAGPGQPTTTVSTTLSDISSYPQFGFNISVANIDETSGFTA